MKVNYSFKIKQKVLNFINENDMIRHGDSVVVGLSGGADSVCLILLLNELRKDIDFDIKAVHINHGIRGITALRDEEYSKALSEKFDIDFTSFHVDIPKISKESGLTEEEAGRNERYRCFAEYIDKLSKEENNQDKRYILALAHHIDDQAETVLFNIVRGSGIKGVGGIEPVKNRGNLRVVRPLLCLTKEEIITYVNENNIDYCTDETNLENDYSRNLIRNEVMRHLNSIQPQSARHISELAKELREAEEVIYLEAEKLFYEAVTKRDEEFVINVNIIKDKKPIVVRYMIIYVLKQLVATYKDITRTHIEDIYSLTSKGKGKKIVLPFSLIAVREKNSIVISKNL